MRGQSWFCMFAFKNLRVAVVAQSVQFLKLKARGKQKVHWRALNEMQLSAPPLYNRLQKASLLEKEAHRKMLFRGVF